MKQEQKQPWKSNTFENAKGEFHIFPQLCKGCGLCIEKCPTSVIKWSKRLGFTGTPAVEPDMEGCIVCGICQNVCPDAAIAIRKQGQSAVGRPAAK